MDIASVIERFVGSFKTNSLEEVMAFFVPDAVYRHFPRLRRDVGV
jgi:hypothetical protein